METTVYGERLETLNVLKETLILHAWFQSLMYSWHS